MTSRRPQASSERDVSGQDAAIYCRISKAEDDDQTGVDRQERICRRIAERFGLRVSPEHVFIDNSRSAWQRKRKRPGWDRMLDGAQKNQFRHIIAYHPDRLMRQPRDLEELLNVSDEHGITLHGEANRHDLSNPDHRFMLRIEVAHACRSSDDTSRRLLSAMEERAETGKPHAGRRRFGYVDGGMEILESEAKWIRQAFRFYLEGKTPVEISHYLNDNGSTTSTGRPWNDVQVRNLLRARHIAAIRVFRGEDSGPGNWPAIIEMGEWKEVQERMTYRARALADTNARKRFYLLRGIMYCTACKTRMSGTSGDYACDRRHQPEGTSCKRIIKAIQTEEFVRDAALNLLEKLKPNLSHATSGLPASISLRVEEDKHQLAELNNMWASKEITTPEYRQMRQEIQKRIDEYQRRMVVRPVKVLEGMTGPNARAAWFADDMTDERRNAILRFLFAAVRIGPATKHGIFDYDRIDIEQNDLSA